MGKLIPRLVAACILVSASHLHGQLRPTADSTDTNGSLQILVDELADNPAPGTAQERKGSTSSLESYFIRPPESTETGAAPAAEAQASPFASDSGNPPSLAPAQPADWPAATAQSKGSEARPPRGDSRESRFALLLGVHPATLKWMVLSLSVALALGGAVLGLHLRRRHHA